MTVFEQMRGAWFALDAFASQPIGNMPVSVAVGVALFFAGLILLTKSEGR
jgi:uncharacterized membrane protein